MFDRIAARAAVVLGLPDGERDVVALLLTGMSCPEAAARLGISLGTVKTYVARLHKRLGVHNRVDLLKPIVKAAEQ